MAKSEVVEGKRASRARVLQVGFCLPSLLTQFLFFVVKSLPIREFVPLPHVGAAVARYPILWAIIALVTQSLWVNS